MEYNMADKEMKNVTPEPSENTENSQEKELIDSTLEYLELNRSHCADVIDDVHFELPYYPDLLAGDYCTYVFYQL